MQQNTVDSHRILKVRADSLTAVGEGISVPEGGAAEDFLFNVEVSLLRLIETRKKAHSDVMRLIFFRENKATKQAKKDRKKKRIKKHLLTVAR